MINDDVLIKFFRKRVKGYEHLTWIEKVRNMKERLNRIKLGFPGIGNDHLSLVRMNDIKEGDIFIYDPYLFNSPGDKDDYYMVAMYTLGKREDGNEILIIEGIGNCENREDPDRILKWKDIIWNFISPASFVLRVDVRPTENGGPGYYYFYKAYRDNRV